MSAALPVMYERNLRSALPQVTVARRGCLLLCVGRSEAVRARVEGALAARLGPGKALVRGSLAERRSDLWRVMANARDESGARPEDTVLSFRLGGERSQDEERLFGLNVGRETRSVERLRLLLWLSGFEQYEALRSTAPDLWAVRTDVHFYLSREDFEVPEGAAPGEVKGVDAEIQEIDEDLQRPGIGARERARLLRRQAARMFEQGRYEEALCFLDKATQERARGEAGGKIDDAGRAQELETRCAVLAQLRRFSERRRLAEEAVRDAETHGDARLGMYASGQLAHALLAAEAHGAALGAFGDQLRYYERLVRDGGRVVLGIGAVFTNRAWAWIESGVLGRAEADADNPVVSSGNEEGRWRLLWQAIVEELRASVARLRGRSIEELIHVHRSCARSVEIQSWRRFDHDLLAVANAYRRIALLDDARSIAEQATSRLVRTGAPLNRAEWHAWLGNLARDTGDLPEAERRYELAVEALRARTPDAEQAALAILAEARIQGTDWAEALPPDAAAPHRAEARCLLQDVLHQPVSIDRHMEAHLALGLLHRASARFEDSTASLTTYRDWARADQGPARASRASIELARTSLAAASAADALLHLAAARADLDREEPLHRSRFVQKEILVVLHDAHLALGDRASAHAALTEALAIVRAEGLRLEELDVLQHLAELPPAAGAADHRLPSAHETIALAREILWPAKEARALATLAGLELSAGHLDAARAALDEATWLAAAVGPTSVRDRVRDLSAKLPQGAPPPPAP